MSHKALATLKATKGSQRLSPQQRHRQSKHRDVWSYLRQPLFSKIDQPIVIRRDNANIHIASADAPLTNNNTPINGAEQQPGRTQDSTQGSRHNTDIFILPARIEDPQHSNMDISTGHAILSYMEDHLNDKDKLESEWNSISDYEPETVLCCVGRESQNMIKNRDLFSLPYDDNRVILANREANYINASFIIDHDPKKPVYIVAQSPMAGTAEEFWQMVWDQGCVTIVNLTRLCETDSEELCHKYWPEQGSELIGMFEVHLVSEHVWCEEYLVRSFYLKNLGTVESRTVTQFHYVAWPSLGVPSSARSLLDFRRKVNKSFRNMGNPILVHCSDGCGRSGTYILLDMILSRLAKGVKEIDIAAALEHLRDQRMNMVKTKDQFEFVLICIAEEVHAILKLAAAATATSSAGATSN